MLPPQGIAALLKEALVVYKGVTDAAGGAGGATLKCSDLATKADWNGNQIIVTSGDYEGQARDINGATTGGTITPANAFGGQIVSGVTFVITGIRTVPAEVAECLAILESDSRRILSTALTAPTVSSLTKFIASGGTALGQPLPASTSLIDILGNFTGPYDGAAQDDNVKASLDLLHTDADRQEQISFFRSDMQASVTLDDSGTADVSLPSVTIASGALPSGHTIDAVYCHFKYGSYKDTSTADNAIDGTQYIQVKEASGSYINAVKIIDNGLPVDVSEATVMGGDVVFGNIDVVAQVAAENKTYNFQWTNTKVDGNNIILYNVQTIIEVRWY